ncbi:hypothetical protein GS429_05355 [Natronorubrum sp. JWXQ-INN-674]|uniref:Amidase domain-containing protein n=1 Tax=Natronorubrum halalkaliphilum TaxID=2691917 RepID=A0A6B0VLP8_9EURY|nr:amidase family protein [Natronorubrum halalkaliphilum]MXV61499.1 hypothetical protein [Natronorubrum halalkaliphilum]
MDNDSDAVRDAATAFGIDLEPEEIAAYADGIDDVRAQLSTLESSTPETDERAADVSEGTDQHNAFRYRCRLSGETGALAGLEVAVKDCIAVAGVPMTCGSAAVEFTPDYSATVTRRLLDAGADLVGTTNMDEFAYFSTGETCAHGRTENPVVDGCVPGGSSSGSGAAVAAGAVDVALGSDTGGSIRIPASFCGVVGFKPTHRTVPRFGFADLSPSLDHVGPLARDVETAAKSLEAISGPAHADPSTLGVEPATGVADAVGKPVDELRIGVVEEAMALSTDGVVETVRDGTTALADAGATVEDVSVPGYLEAPLAVLGTMGPEFSRLIRTNGQLYGTGTGYSEAWRTAVATTTDSGGYGENVRDQLITGDATDATTDGRLYVAAQNVRREFTETVDDRLADYDALVTPTTPIPAPPFGEVTALDDLVQTVANTGPFNLTGHPALSVPCGETDGKPVGFQIVADRHAEPTAVRLGATVEAAVGP